MMSCTENCTIVLVSLYSSDAIGLRYISSFLKAHGMDVHLIFFKEKYLESDEMSLPTNKEYQFLLDIISRLQPVVIGVSLRSSFFRIATAITEKIRKTFGMPVIWGGTHPNVAPEECIQVSDMICIGEGEHPMLELASQFAKGENVHGIQNLWIRTEKEIIRNPVRAPVQDLDSLPFPDYGHEGKYLIEDDSVSGKDPALGAFNLNVMGSRGCPYHCSYCCNSVFRQIYKGKGPPVRRRSVDNVLEEIESMRERFPGLQRIDFIDEVFAWDKSWSMEFTAKYKKRVNLPFQCAQHPNMVDRDILEMLTDAGLERVEVGLQSGSERIRREVFERPVSDDSLLNVAGIISDLKIIPFYDLIVDNPFETEEDKRRGLEFILQLPRPFHLRMFPLTYFPNTMLTQKALASGRISPDQVESKAERTHNKWFVTLDYPWLDGERYWISLFSLTSKSFIPKRLIRWLSRIRILRGRPLLLSSFATVANNIKLGTIAIKWLLEGKPLKSVFSHARKGRGHWQI